MLTFTQAYPSYQICGAIARHMENAFGAVLCRRDKDGNGLTAHWDDMPGYADGNVSVHVGFDRDDVLRVTVSVEKDGKENNPYDRTYPLSFESIRDAIYEVARFLDENGIAFVVETGR